MNITELAIYKKMFGGGTSGATAYTVSSVDELPSNAVEGSMAIVPSDSLIGKWQWKDNQSPLDLSMLNLPSGEFNECVVILGFDNFDSVTDRFNFINRAEGFSIQLNDYSYLYRDDYFDDTFEEIEFFTEPKIYEPTVFTETDFKTFIKTNCNRLSGGYSLYTHENGEWVYKCEVA